MYAIILCGGSGTRLWPLSRKNYPKQFLKLYSDKSLLQETYLRMRDIIAARNIYFVTNKDNYFNVFNQIKEIDKSFIDKQIIVEPASLNTAPAIALAVKYLTDKMKINKRDPIIEIHSDHYIGKKEVYSRVVKKALKNVGNNLGTIGIIPTKPDTGLGYIEKGEQKGRFHKVARFKEKPDLKTAKKFLASGKYLWNAGMYVFNAETFSKELEKHASKIYAFYKKDYETFVKNFKKLPNIAIDYAITEKSKKVIAFEGDFDWSDIGSFDVLSEIAEKHKNINTRHVSVDSNNIYIHSDNKRLVATVGVDDINVVESYDAILVQKKGKNSEVKKVVEYLKDNNFPEVDHNIIVHRPWGKYEVLINRENHKVKKVTVYPGAMLSLQSHKFRAEHWVVIKGEARIVNGENLLVLHENESAYIKARNKHRLENPGKSNLEIIEVQTGSYLEEDDIIRYKDVYGRHSGVAAA